MLRAALIGLAIVVAGVSLFILLGLLASLAWMLDEQYDR